MPDITQNGPVMSAKVTIADVEVYQLKNYGGASSILPIGDHPNTYDFPEGEIASLKVTY